MLWQRDVSVDRNNDPDLSLSFSLALCLSLIVSQSSLNSTGSGE